MPKYITVRRAIPNYTLDPFPEKYLQMIYDNSSVKGLYYAFQINGLSSKAKEIEIAGINFQIANATIKSLTFDLQKLGEDELYVINILKEIKKKLWDDYYIEPRPYLISQKILDNGTPPNYAQLITHWDKYTHIKADSPLGIIIAPETMPIEMGLIAHIKRNKEGHIKADKKKILLEIKKDTLFLKLDKVLNLCHGLALTEAIFYGTKCTGYLDYQVVPKFISDQACEIVPFEESQKKKTT